MFENLPRNHYGTIVADPPWRFETWSDRGKGRAPERHYPTMRREELEALPVQKLAAPNCALFLWTTWPMLESALGLIRAWGFRYKTCGFLWAKVKPRYAGELLFDFFNPFVGLGYWTRANSEPCLLATRGNPKRMARDVQQLIIEPPREHSRKPDCVRERIERLVYGPYLELFARSRREGWDSWGNETQKFA